MSNTSVMRVLLFAFLAIGIFLMAMGYQLRYYTRTGPGPGFFPVWIGALLTLCSLWACVGSFIGERDELPFVASAEAAGRVGAVLAGLFATWLLLEFLGFRIAIFLFSLAVPPLLGRQRLLVLVATAAVFSFGTAYVFETWLGVWLPRSSIGFLADLGL